MKPAIKVMTILLATVVMCTLMQSMKAMAASEGAIELKYGSQYPQTHPYAVADQHWIDKIEKETNGRVKITPYWAETLLTYKDSMDGVAKGTVEIGSITLFETGLDLTKALIGYFRGSPSDKVNVKIYWELYDKFPELRKEFERVKLLGCTAGSPWRLMTIKPVRTLTDLKGMKIKTTSDSIAPLKEYGAEGLEIPMKEAYERMKNGTLDGVFTSVEAYKSMKLAEVVKYETQNFFVTRGPNGARGMSWNAWNKLPPDIQKVFEANKEWWSLEILNVMDKLDAEGREEAGKAGVQIIQMPASEVQKFEDVHELENVKMARELDKKGPPATKLYNEARRLVKVYSAKK